MSRNDRLAPCGWGKLGSRTTVFLYAGMPKCGRTDGVGGEGASVSPRELWSSTACIGSTLASCGTLSHRIGRTYIATISRHRHRHPIRNPTDRHRHSIDIASNVSQVFSQLVRLVTTEVIYEMRVVGSRRRHHFASCSTANNTPPLGAHAPYIP